MNPLDSFEAFKSLVHSETLGALMSGDVEKIVLNMQTMGSKDPARLLHFVNGRLDEASSTPLHVLSEFSAMCTLPSRRLLSKTKPTLMHAIDMAIPPYTVQLPKVTAKWFAFSAGVPTFA